MTNEEFFKMMAEHEAKEEMNQRSEYEESRCNPIKKNYIMN
jgi:hypothetical protein